MYKAQQTAKHPELHLNTSSNLVICWSCNQKISKRATKCPKCDSPSKSSCCMCGSEISIIEKTCPVCGDPSPFDFDIEDSHQKTFKNTQNNDDLEKNSSGIFSQVIWSIIVLILGVIAFGVLQETTGRGQYVVAGIIVFALLYIWNGKPKESNK